MTVGVGLIGPKRGANGYGLGQYVAREVLNCSTSTLVALMGTTRESVLEAVKLINSERNTTRTFSGVPYTIEQKDEFFQRNDVDVVIICSPPQTHEQYIREALRNNKHVLVETPLIKLPHGMSLSSKIQLAGKLLDIANEKNLFLSTNCQRAAVVGVLKEQLGITDTPSMVQIELAVGVKSKGLEGPHGLFDLLIAHPLSILVKFGASDYESMQVQEHSVLADSRAVRLRLRGRCQVHEREMMYAITLQQSMTQSLATMRVTIDNIGPINITTELSNQGQVTTLYKALNTSSAALYGEDTLKISIKRIVDAVAQTEELRCPLITNAESFTVYAIQEVMREALKTASSRQSSPRPFSGRGDKVFEDSNTCLL